MGWVLDDRVVEVLKSNSQLAAMPSKIHFALDNDDPSSDKYNKYDKQIAVATHLINREIKKGTLSIGAEYE
jgi:hypothetical protein